MEPTEIINIFSTFGFPTAMVIVMGYAMWKMYKSNEANNRKTVEESIKIRDQFISYIQMSNVELTGTLKESTMATKESATALKENAETYKENAAALNRFAVVLEKMENKLKVEN